MTYKLSDSIHIDESPAEIYDLISDVTRTGEWSQQCYRCDWDGPGRHDVGATFTGHNRTPEREWTTTSEVVIAEPGQHFAWEVIPARARWGYTISPEGEGSVLTEYTVFSEETEANFLHRFGEEAERQIEIRQEAAAAGIPETLKTIKRIAEQSK
ncbi:SRPBCC family protein [Rothia uropygioeca]|uniref:SRPBCC family protein n=1 Tax=Kocuria sp. 257 TaxID=2021970 RepID=UPI001012A546|nr:SRPBCC family protein [Kocuria sp. 257]